MTDPANALAIARQRIAEEAAVKTGTLDLAGLGLDELPAEISSLRHLIDLDLGSRLEKGKILFNRFTDLTLLAELIVLRWLDCSNTSFADLTPLAGLKALESLKCWNTSVTNIAPLAGLTALQSLDCSYTSVGDLSPLAALTALQSLDCSYTSVFDLAPLSGLTALQSLNCSYTSVIDLAPLAGLTALESLNCSDTSATDLAPLASLTALQLLDCSDSLFVDLAPLTGLTKMQSLNCSGTSATDLAPLASLTALQSLDCSHTSVADLGPLAGLTALQSLHCSGTSVANLAPLAGLTALQLLDCSVTSVADLTPLSGLTALRTLECAGTSVADLAPIAALAHLRVLNVSHCRLRPPPTVFWQRLTLTQLILHQTVLPGIPAELLSTNGYDDHCLPRLLAHFADLEPGTCAMTDVKLLVLGNGRAGKTQLVNRLRGPAFPYQPEWDSTHGVQVASASLATQDGSDTRLHLWDFGGQDIYHGTHALFTRTRAITAVVWACDTEREQAYERDGIRFRNHPLRYWVNYARHQGGAGNPLLIVQGKCDAPADDVRRPPVDDADLGDLTACELRYSALNDRGRAALDEKLREAAALVHGSNPPLIGAGRLRVQRRLEVLRDADAARPRDERQYRTLDQAEFLRFCQEEGGVSDPALLLDYLHHCGVLFYRPGLFNDHIILDQGWALDAIYAVFQRQKSYRHLRFTGGRFTRPLLADLVWGEYSEAEQWLFLSMMQQCGICFVHRHGADRYCEDDDTEYLAPDLLPDRNELQAQIDEKWDAEAATESVEFRYPFAHAGLMRSLTARIGNQAGIDALYWQGGLCLYEASTRSRALLEYRIADDWRGTLGVSTQAASPASCCAGCAARWTKNSCGWDWHPARHCIGK